MKPGFQYRIVFDSFVSHTLVFALQRRRSNGIFGRKWKTIDERTTFSTLFDDAKRLCRVDAANGLSSEIVSSDEKFFDTQNAGF